MVNLFCCYCLVSNFLFIDGRGSQKKLLQWKRIDLIFFFFFPWAIYYRSYSGEVNAAFPLLSEFFFLNASTDCKFALGSGAFTDLLADVANLNPAA